MNCYLAQCYWIKLSCTDVEVNIKDGYQKRLVEAKMRVRPRQIGKSNGCIGLHKLNYHVISITVTERSFVIKRLTVLFHKESLLERI